MPIACAPVASALAQARAGKVKVFATQMRAAVETFARGRKAAKVEAE